MKSSYSLAFAVVAALAATGAQAQAPAAGHESHHAAASAPGAVAWTDGEVRKVDKASGKVTLKHGRIANLDMPGMTMAFPVADARLLETVKSGDKVRFVAEMRDGAITVTALQAVE